MMMKSARQRRKEQENADILTGDFVSTEKDVDSTIPQLSATNIWKKAFAGKGPVSNDILNCVNTGLEVQKAALETTDVNTFILSQENITAESLTLKIKCLTVVTVNMKNVVKVILRRMWKHHTHMRGLTIVTRANYPRIKEMT